MFSLPLFQDYFAFKFAVIGGGGAMQTGYFFILLHHCPHRTQGKPRARTHATCVHFSVLGVSVMPHNAQARLLLLMMLGS